MSYNFRISWLGILHIYNIWNSVIRIAIYLVVRKCYFVDFLAVKVNGSDVKPGICLVTPRCFNIQTSRGLRISVYFHQIVPIRFKIK